MSHERPLRIFIYGSCVSRDTFEGLDRTKFALVEYVARQSLISAFAPHTFPLPAPEVTSRFRARMLEGDLSGSLASVVTRHASDTDALLWDLADERLGIYVLPDGSVVTRTADMIGTALDDACAHSGRLLEHGSDEHFSLFTEALGHWTGLLRMHRMLERTLVLAPEWASHDTDGTPVPTSFGISSDVANDRYRRYYAAVETAGFTVVRAEDVTASAEHRWGTAPFHYADDVYAGLHADIAAWVAELRPHHEARSHGQTTGGGRRDLDRYRHAITRHRDISEFLASPVAAGISTFDYNSSPFDILVLPHRGARTTIIFFHPATPLINSLPIFTGLDVTKEAIAHRVFVSDPSLELDDDLRLAWFAGNERQPVQTDLPQILNHVTSSLGSEHTVLYGGSGGGFAALYYSAKMPGSLAIPVNPQTIIQNYDAEVAEKYVNACWPGTRSLGWRTALQRCVEGDLRRVYAQPRPNTVAYVQNERDWHVTRHMEPFLEVIADHQSHRLLSGDWGPGHAAPPKDVIRELLTAAADCEGDWEQFLDTQGFALPEGRRPIS